MSLRTPSATVRLAETIRFSARAISGCTCVSDLGQAPSASLRYSSVRRSTHCCTGATAPLGRMPNAIRRGLCAPGPTGSSGATGCQVLRQPPRSPPTACHPPSSTRPSLQRRTSRPVRKQTGLSRPATRAAAETLSGAASLDAGASAPASALRHRAHSAKRSVLRPRAQTPSRAQTSRGRASTTSF
eukprot:1032950-Alexandrium_andersonii.AAC.1